MIADLVFYLKERRDGKRNSQLDDRPVNQDFDFADMVTPYRHFKCVPADQWLENFSTICGRQLHQGTDAGTSLGCDSVWVGSLVG